MQSIRAKVVKGLIRKVVKGYVAKAAPGLEQRKMLDSVSKLNIPAELIKVEPVILGGEAGAVKAAWVRHGKASREKVIIHFHGGGYTSGSIESHKSLAFEISKESQASVLLPEYRLAPEYPFPAALDDAVTVYKAILEQGIKPGNIIISGDSAGGGLALATVLSLRKSRIPLPSGIICLSPWTDLTCSGGTYISKLEADPFLVPEVLVKSSALYCGKNKSSNPFISPLFSDMHDFPPMLIHVGSEEILLDDSLRLAKEAKKAGVKVTIKVWPGMWHVWHIFGVPESSEALKAIGKFARKYLK
jgi:acetyl esterase/lipase